MHKKLTKYINSYDVIEDTKSYTLVPNGGMIVLINNENSCEVTIENTLYEIDSFQIILLNAYTCPLEIKSDKNINMVAVRFKGAGASFFYEEYMDELMYNPNTPIYLEKLEENKDIKELDPYFQNRFKASPLPFNIMKIIELLDKQGSEYNIDEVLGIANVPRKILDKMFRLRAGLTFKTYASINELEH